jgi:hypothetical protein
VEASHTTKSEWNAVVRQARDEKQAMELSQAGDKP